MDSLHPQVARAERSAAWVVFALGVLELALLQYQLRLPEKLLRFAAVEAMNFWRVLASAGWSSWRPPALAALVVFGLFNANLLLKAHLLGRGLGRQWLFPKEVLWWACFAVGTIIFVLLFNGLIYTARLPDFQWSAWLLRPSGLSVCEGLAISALQAAIAVRILWLASRN